MVRQLRLKGVNLVAYLDYWLIRAESTQECTQTVKLTLDFLQELSFCISWEKLCLQPAQLFQWLALHWNLTDHTLSINRSKCIQIACQVQKFFGSQKVSRRMQESPWIPTIRSNCLSTRQRCYQDGPKGLPVQPQPLEIGIRILQNGPTNTSSLPCQ